MKTADIRTADRHQIPFHFEVVARSHRAGLIGRGVDAIDGVENLRPQRLWHNPTLDNHDS